MSALVIPFPKPTKVELVCDQAAVATLSDQIAEIISAHLKAARTQDAIFEALEALARQVAFIIVPAETEFDGVASWFDDALREKLEQFSGELEKILDREGDAP